MTGTKTQVYSNDRFWFFEYVEQIIRANQFVFDLIARRKMFNYGILFCVLFLKMCQ